MPAPNNPDPSPAPPKETAHGEPLTPNEVLSEIFVNLWKFILLFLLCGFIFVGTCVPAGISVGLDNANTNAPLWCAVVAAGISWLAALWFFRASPIRRTLMVIVLALGMLFIAFIALIAYNF